MPYERIACLADASDKAQESFALLKKKHNFVRLNQDPDALLVLGGDGFMLHSLHETMKHAIPVYGMNCGTVGFLMNEFTEDFPKKLEEAKLEKIHPLKMEAQTLEGKKSRAVAINEVSLLRETRQTAQLKVSVDGAERIPELVCDGILLATSAGSTAYNLSAYGPIVPLGSHLLALTPISPFRPRRWRGALLPHRAKVEIEVLDPKKRPVSAVADFTEVRDVTKVIIKEDRKKTIKLLFDRGHSLEERIISEQFSF